MRIGGGHNHRHGLYDMVMMGTTTPTSPVGYRGRTRGPTLHRRQCAEAGHRSGDENLNEVRLALSVNGVQRIMLDNFGFEDLRNTSSVINRACETEASGGITLAMRALRGMRRGLHQRGALTHSAGSSSTWSLKR